MRVLLVQIGDIHLRQDSDVSIERTAAAVAALRPLLAGTKEILLLLTGDLAFSGDGEEYSGVLNVITRLAEGLRGEVPDTTGIRIVAIPGNHDCDFRSPTPARDILRATVLGERPDKVDPQVVDLCCEPQDQFLTLRDALAGPPSAGDKLFYEYAVQLSDSRTLLVRCLNTAWLSQLREEPGTLHFPVEHLPSDRGDAELVITLLHHPYNWFAPDTLRKLRRRLEASSDLILTGHEHEFAQRFHRSGNTEVNIYIEGACFHDSEDPSSSGFSAILIDLDTRRQRSSQFVLRDDVFEDVRSYHEWEEYQVSKIRRSGQFALRDSMVSFLNDLGILLTHPSKGVLTLPDVFVYPDFREVSYVPNEVKPVVRGETLLDLSRERRWLLVSGVEQSGKTCLARRLFSDLLAQGTIPLYVDASKARLHDDDKLESELRKLFEAQYEGEAQRYLQLSPSQRALIVDNYHRLKLRNNDITQLISALQNFAGQVILISGDLTHHQLDIAGPKAAVERAKRFLHLRMLPFGHMRRNELTERWFGLDHELVGDPERYARRVMQVKAVSDTAIGKNFLPSYPIFILPLLQAQEHSDQIDLHASTYGYYYELLIRRSLAVGNSREGFDVNLSYLTELAYEMFQKGRQWLTDQELRAFHARFETQHLIDVGFIKLQASLEKSGILQSADDRYLFKYQYYYYYFVANYLSDNVATLFVRSDIERLAANLHHEESANILLFLAHLSKDPFIIERMLDTARGMFTDYPAIELRPDQSPLGAADAVEKSVYEDHGSAGRSVILRRMDQASDEEVDQTDDVDVNEQVQRIFAAFKTLQILGQLLKNFPGSLSGSVKKELTRECIALGLRTLGFYFDAVKQSSEGLIVLIIAMLRDVDPTLVGEELERKARRSLFSIVHRGSYGVLKRMSYAIGSPALFPVYEAVVQEWPVPSVELVHLSLKLDQSSGFPEAETLALAAELQANPLALSLLRALVIHHFHLFEVGFKLKQSLCAELKIEYARVVGGTRTKLLSKAAEKS